MAEVIGTDHGGHGAGHEGIGPECPVSCLGVRTVGDLLRLLVSAGRVSGLHAEFAATVAGIPHEHEQVTAACPIECLGVSARVVNALRSDRAGYRRWVMCWRCCGRVSWARCATSGCGGSVRCAPRLLRPASRFRVRCCEGFGPVVDAVPLRGLWWYRGGRRGGSCRALGGHAPEHVCSLHRR